MRLFRNGCFLIIFCCCSGLYSQHVKLLVAGPKQSFRGLSVVSDRIIWVSGAKGTVGKSADGGKTWEWMTVAGYENCDFRDIEAFSKKEAIIMAIASPAYILKTVDGGKTWKKVYENHEKNMFLDAIAFYDSKNGVVVGDPIGGSFFLAHTTDGGNSWRKLENYYKPDTGEACFASSGTNIIFPINPRSFEIVTGGSHAERLKCTLYPKSSEHVRYIHRGELDEMTDPLLDSVVISAEPLPLLLQGKNSTGANSIAALNWMTEVVVGGDFSAKDSTRGNCIYSRDGRNWNVPKQGPSGYRSCAAYLGEGTYICCGLNGVDLSGDFGETWKKISSDSFHACQKAKKGKAVFFIGNEGQIGKLMP
ncbi:MAG: WD40/YVTN/BNR-like repeat-containing protein [Bacteroidia bacterium]